MKTEHAQASEKLNSDVEAFLAKGGKVKQIETEAPIEAKIKFIQARNDITQNQKDFKIKKMREGKQI